MDLPQAPVGTAEHPVTLVVIAANSLAALVLPRHSEPTRQRDFPALYHSSEHQPSKRC